MHTKSFADMPWERVDLSAAELDLPIAVGGSTAPHRLLEAHRHGAFPYPRDELHRPQQPPRAGDERRALYARHVADGRIAAFPTLEEPDAYALTWWSPTWRPVLEVGSAHLAGSLRRHPGGAAPGWIATCDHAFAGVVSSCRDQAAARWLTDPLRASLLSLHQAGWAHSIEIWHGEELIAGLFGTGIGQVFSVDSAFGRHPQATGAAFADLSRRLRGRAAYIDMQVPHPYAAALGTRSISRAEYLDALLTVDLPVALRAGVLALEPAGPDAG
ncbi:hypothetical protein OG455_02285 [Kitasatospora sp. NBC_01287]|uniref:leucyl/phenylalanyl-tRNA--protein transferase n=1 Tax=Kitasatospora sp. NBC_01287 TaxID=2903573 RepID=UPI00225914C9|nr:hypothetical protein [Kitasatospora sp. NBC_01287]MCX4744353.1 hypothetical protein [Kitasatospora sp. NBC_01287]